VHKADNLPPSCAVVKKSENLNFLKPSGPVQACNGIDLPLPLLYVSSSDIINVVEVGFNDMKGIKYCVSL